MRGVAADLGTLDGVETFLNDAPEADILVNNLGIFEAKPFEEITDADWLRFFEVNVLSGVRLARHYLHPHARQELGPGDLYLQRVGREYSRGDDSLRNDQDGASGGGARFGGVRGRHRHHGELGSGGTHRAPKASATSCMSLPSSRA